MAHRSIAASEVVLAVIPLASARYLLLKNDNNDAMWGIPVLTILYKIVISTLQNLYQAPPKLFPIVALYQQRVSSWWCVFICVN